MTTGDKGKLFSLFVPLFTLPTQQDCVLSVVCIYSENRATSEIWIVLRNMFFLPVFFPGGGGGGMAAF